jgi:hypothetical protein
MTEEMEDSNPGWNADGEDVGRLKIRTKPSRKVVVQVEVATARHRAGPIGVHFGLSGDGGGEWEGIVTPSEMGEEQDWWTELQQRDAVILMDTTQVETEIIDVIGELRVVSGLKNMESVTVIMPEVGEPGMMLAYDYNSRIRKLDDLMKGCGLRTIEIGLTSKQVDLKSWQTQIDGSKGVLVQETAKLWVIVAKKEGLVHEPIVRTIHLLPTENQLKVRRIETPQAREDIMVVQSNKGQVDMVMDAFGVESERRYTLPGPGGRGTSVFFCPTPGNIEECLRNAGSVPHLAAMSVKEWRGFSHNEVPHKYDVFFIRDKRESESPFLWSKIRQTMKAHNVSYEYLTVRGSNKTQIGIKSDLGKITFENIVARKLIEEGMKIKRTGTEEFLGGMDDGASTSSRSSTGTWTGAQYIFLTEVEPWLLASQVRKMLLTTVPEQRALERMNFSVGDRATNTWRVEVGDPQLYVGTILVHDSGAYRILSRAQYLDEKQKVLGRRPVTGACFRCGKEGHWASSCTETRPPLGAAMGTGQRSEAVPKTTYFARGRANQPERDPIKVTRVDRFHMDVSNEESITKGWVSDDVVNKLGEYVQDMFENDLILKDYTGTKAQKFAYGRRTKFNSKGGITRIEEEVVSAPKEIMEVVDGLGVKGDNIVIHVVRGEIGGMDGVNHKDHESLRLGGTVSLTVSGTGEVYFGRDGNPNAGDTRIKLGTGDVYHFPKTVSDRTFHRTVNTGGQEDPRMAIIVFNVVQEDPEEEPPHVDVSDSDEEKERVDAGTGEKENGDLEMTPKRITGDTRKRGERTPEESEDEDEQGGERARKTLDFGNGE